MKQNILIPIIALLIIQLNAYSQHEAGYGNYMFNGSIINPAYCGSNGVLNTTLSYKNQWVNFDAAPKTIAFSAHSPLKNENYNIGLLVLNDKFGITSKNRYLAAYAHRIKLNKEISMRFGIQAGMETIRNDYSKLIIIQSGDATFTNIQSNILYFTSGAGVYLQSKKMFAGLSMPVMANTYLQSVNSFKPIFAYGGYLFDLNQDFKIQPSLLLKYIKNAPAQMDINAMATYQNKFGLGLSYRTNNIFIANLNYQINNQFFIAYAIDINGGKVARLSRTSHEIVLRYQFGYSKNIQNPKTFF